MKLVAWEPIKERSVGNNEPGISPGLIPEGESGIHLVVVCGGREISQKIAVTIESEEGR